MSEKTIAFPVWERLAHVLREEKDRATHTCKSFLQFVHEATRKRPVEELYEEHINEYKQLPARLALNRFEERIKLVRHKYVEPQTKEEKEWLKYTRDYFYDELVRLYQNAGLPHDVTRLGLEKDEGNKKTNDVKDADGNVVGTETNAESKELPIRSIELSTARRK